MIKCAGWVEAHIHFLKKGGNPLRETLSFVNEKRTIHFTLRNNELRIVVKSATFQPDTLMAKVNPQDFSYLAVAQRSLRLKSDVFDLQHCLRMEWVFFDVQKRTLTLSTRVRKEIFVFSESEWSQIVSFLP